MASKSNTLNNFLLESAQQHTPARITQCYWQQDEAFVSALRTSWQRQYADYLGSEAAESLMNRIHTTGDIYKHTENGTFIAALDDQKVGIVAVRDLDKLFLITLLDVLPEHQGKGIASQMLNVICSLNKPLLVHVSVHRPWLKTLYERQGFKCLAPEVIEHYGHSLTFDVMVKT